MTLPITYTVCVQHCTCNYDKFVTSTCFRIRVNINLVNTTVHPKGNMPDHLYHGNIKCFCRSNVYSWHLYIYFFKHIYICFFAPELPPLNYHPWITTLELSNVCPTREPSCNVDMIVEKQLNELESPAKMFLLPTGVYLCQFGTLVMLRWSISILIQICYVFFVLLKAVSQTLDF